jgi:hypothetical protein
LEGVLKVLEETRFCQKNKKTVRKSVRKNQAGRGGRGGVGPVHHLPAGIYGFLAGKKKSSFIFGRNVTRVKIVP